MSGNRKILIGTNEEANAVRNKLIEFNSRHVPNGYYEEIHLCVKDDEGEMMAGLNSTICWNWMEIDILWVDDNHRGQGLGKRLLEEAEQMARAKHCTFIKLNTFSFQAPEFYKKYGYEEMAMIEDAPMGYRHYYFKKNLM
ncbi:GNAT family N-acetyltransferase [Paenibacillus sp. HJL G12]|uniref:GNAT family N-acetyltransferase n=1 Tax=Paenibacillus dendrobii TaxID=2691084 RepID=A0A7X3LII4_9BACL|nr:GNAT family N-acetyltransferase [Paenibacillus dendrobii]MWV44314.1 GNAT family N-acetyltransferase [Paenibacillus dendrobii]